MTHWFSRLRGIQPYKERPKNLWISQVAHKSTAEVVFSHFRTTSFKCVYETVTVTPFTLLVLLHLIEAKLIDTRVRNAVVTVWEDFFEFESWCDSVIRLVVLAMSFCSYTYLFVHFCAYKLLRSQNKIKSFAETLFYWTFSKNEVWKISRGKFFAHLLQHFKNLVLIFGQFCANNFCVKMIPQVI